MLPKKAAKGEFTGRPLAAVIIGGFGIAEVSGDGGTELPQAVSDSAKRGVQSLYCTNYFMIFSSHCKEGFPLKWRTRVVTKMQA